MIPEKMHESSWLHAMNLCHKRFYALGGNKQFRLILKHYHNMCACSRERRRAARVGKEETAAPNRAVNIHPAGVQEKLFFFFFLLSVGRSL